MIKGLNFERDPSFPQILVPVENLWKTFGIIDRLVSYTNFGHNPLMVVAIYFFVTFFCAGQALCQDFNFNQSLGVFRSDIAEVLSGHKLDLIESFAQKNYIYRISQLGTISGVGSKSIDFLSRIVGVFFEYNIEEEIGLKCAANRLQKL